MKKLLELKVNELKRELEERDEDISGNKSALQLKLKEALIREGNDPNNFLFQDEFDGLNKTLDERFEVLNKNLDERFDRINTDFDSLSRKMNNSLAEVEKRLELDIKNMGSQFEEVDDKIKKLTNEINLIKLGTSSNSQDSSHTSPKVKKVKAPVYDGNIPWKIFKKQFDQAAVYNAWNNEDKLANLTLALQGEPAGILGTVSTGSTFEDLVEALDARFGEEHLQPLHRSQFASRKRRPKESLQEYAADIERLGRLAYGHLPDNALHPIMIQAFIQGLDVAEMAAAVTMAEKTKFWHAVGIALNYETVRKAFQPLYKVYKVVGEEDDEEENLKIQQISNGPRRLICYYCHEEGHVKAKCPKRKKEELSSEN